MRDLLLRRNLPAGGAPDRLYHLLGRFLHGSFCLKGADAGHATGEGRLYLAAVLDLHTRKIVGWSMRDRLYIEIALEALNSPSSGSGERRG